MEKRAIIKMNSCIILFLITLSITFNSCNYELQKNFIGNKELIYEGYSRNAKFKNGKQLILCKDNKYILNYSYKMSDYSTIGYYTKDNECLILNSIYKKPEKDLNVWSYGDFDIDSSFLFHIEAFNFGVVDHFGALLELDLGDTSLYLFPDKSGTIELRTIKDPRISDKYAIAKILPKEKGGIYLLKYSSDEFKVYRVTLVDLISNIAKKYDVNMENKNVFHIVFPVLDDCFNGQYHENCKLKIKDNSLISPNGDIFILKGSNT